MHCWDDAGQEWEGNLAFAVFLKRRTVLPSHEIKIVAKERDNALKVVRTQGCGSVEERQLHLAGVGAHSELTASCDAG